MSDTIFDMSSISRKISINGKEYKVSNYVISDYAQSKDDLKLERKEEIEEIRELLSDPKERDNAVREKLRPITDSDLMDYMNGALGATKSIYKMMDRVNKNFMSFDDFSAQVSMETIADIATLMVEQEPKKNTKRGRPPKS